MKPAQEHLLQLAGCSIIGRLRDHNEDAVAFGPPGDGMVFGNGSLVGVEMRPPGALLVVSDGIGGHNAGEVASALAVRALAAALARHPFSPSGLLAAIRAVDQEVKLRAATTPEWNGMGATLTCLWIQEGRALWGQAGDSRGYRWRPPTDRTPRRGSALHQFTPEHSPIGRLVRAGAMSEEAARRHPRRHLIDQSLGCTGDVFAPEAGKLDLRAGDLFLLCSDGLIDGLDDAGLAAVLEGAGDEPPAETAARLVAAADRASGRDNITALVGRVAGAAAPSARRSLFGWMRR